MNVNFDVNSALEKLAEGLGIAVDKLYPILYKQAILNGIMDIFWIIFFTVAIVGFIFTMRYISKKQKEKLTHEWDWDEPRQILIVSLGGILTLVGLIVIPLMTMDCITAFYNTDYYMIKDILEKINVK